MTAVLSADQKKSLFDRSQFRAELTVTPQPSQAYRKCLEQANTLMNAWFNEGEEIQKLVTGRAWLIDQVLILAWEHLAGKDAADIALVAVGGYGRGELHPQSDIDILILLKNEDAEPHRDTIEQFLTLLWDINLKVGSSVRSVKECAKQGRDDLTIITNMIESRLLSGKSELFDAMHEAISPARMWNSSDYLQAKYNEQRARHQKFNQTMYNLEPNLKSSPGGLRDLHMIGWVARRHFGTNDPRELVNIGFLIEREYQVLVRARDFLWQVRWALHRLAKRPEDRLLFDHQRTLAKEFGYEDIEGGALAVEQFMQKYFRAVMSLGVLNDLLLQHFDVTILDNGTQHTPVMLNERFQVRNEYLDAIDPKIFFNHPPAIMEAFVLMSGNPFIEGMTAETIRALRDARHLIDDDFRKNPEVHKLFLDLMRAPYALTASLRRMTRYGILGRYLPEFGHIIGQMQHDLFHNYTVDAHTLLLIKYLRRFNYKESQEQFPVACSAKKRLPKPELLYIAGLYHDIGKGRGGDHSVLGAEDAQKFALLHGLPAADRSLIEWLVRHHLVMSVTAQRQDLSDPETINNFARFVGDSRRLDYLYCLTVADINATNPTLWNGWRASLLRELFHETRRALHRGLENPIDKAERIHDTQEQAREMLELNQVDTSAVNTFWDGLGDDYFLRHNAPEVAWQTQGILDNANQTPLVLVRESTERRYEGGTAVFIYTPDVPNLFAACTTALGELNLTIHDARIITSTSGFALDTFIVLDAATGEPLGDDPNRIERIQSHIIQRLNSAELPRLDPANYHVPRQLKHFTRPPRIAISNDPVNRRTVVEVKATDRPGLLANLGQVFMEQKVLIHNAKISTLGEKVEDVFFITDRDNNPISASEKVQQLHKALTNRLNSLIAD
ncbi:[protein-PII] uridylyltransferase [Parendozoicomonas haliclonae]|uniref:Bifunctional uridylyltransferase/uridylyl-removing enzyme n=1 Tax=Parendozoicomonas haliclonae TaxID=1960125 RepID=A0A1X7AI04_9GAMM|nr:[protein-PII] uridylyltransferase [Parendozoicomonas haliclonae]SMA42667.1 Bifunctional uridylyltransferase/uridylyl-removing enzyme [Parendozoicomonas haliclonae]